MNQKDWQKRIEKRELRVIYRTRRLEQEQRKRENKKECEEKKAAICKEAAEVLKADKKKLPKPDKKPIPGFFLSLYSYIPQINYDIPPAWKPHSFNERKQHLEFLKKFVYPYPLPETLIWATHSPEYIYERNGKRNKSDDYDIVTLAKKWIIDITSGESFYKRNKMYFTKAESHYFLCSNIPYSDSSSVIKLYFYAKCRARSMNHKTSLMIAVVFTAKFLKYFMDKRVEGFLDLLARNPDYRYERGMVGDLCDFVLEKIRRKKPYSFSGRTIASVIALTNEWHEDLRREAEAGRALREAYRREHRETKNSFQLCASRWSGMGLAQFRYETDEYTWTVTELKTAQELLNEGRKMKNCVGSYVSGCAKGDEAVFTIERICHSTNQTAEKVATLEVHTLNRTLVQAKGKCNAAITLKTMSVVNRWAQANRITVRLTV